MSPAHIGLVYETPVTACPTFTKIVGYDGFVIEHASLAFSVEVGGGALVYVRQFGSSFAEVRRDPWTGTATVVDSFGAAGGWALAIDSNVGTIYGLFEFTSGNITLRNCTTGSNIATMSGIGNMTGFNNRNSAAWDPTTGSIFLLTTLGLYRVTTAGSASLLASATGSIFGDIGPATGDGGVWFRNTSGSTTRHWSPTYGVRAMGRNTNSFIHCNPAGDLYHLWNGPDMDVSRNIQQASVTLTPESTGCAPYPEPDGLFYWKMSTIPTDDYSSYTLLFFWGDSRGSFWAWRVTGG